jgi:hypothetical protein
MTWWKSNLYATLKNAKADAAKRAMQEPLLLKKKKKLIIAYYETVKPYLSQESIAEIDKKGNFEYDDEFGWVTPTLPSDNEICVYALRESNGIIKCAFEQAYNDGVIPWKKPISCHLYPILARKGKHGDYERVNYEPREQLCSPGCSLGEKLKVPVYEFLKEALVRKYGKDFYSILDKIAKQRSSSP